MLAVPFDKGIGICVMKKEDYNKILDAILQLPQFEKLKLRKNAKHPVMSEEERIIGILKKMREEERIEEALSTRSNQWAGNFFINLTSRSNHWACDLYFYFYKSIIKIHWCI